MTAATLPEDVYAGVVELRGPDAIAFAQAQTMNDVRVLADGEWQWNGLLNPKGRLIALFLLLRVDTETLWLLCCDHPPGPLASALSRFVFRSKVQLRWRDDLRCTGVVGHCPDAGAPACRMIELPGRTPRRVLLWIPSEAPPPFEPDAAVEHRRWRFEDIAHGVPRLGPEQVEAFTPQMLGLERIAAYSVKKGCYPGQEIVARTHFLGQAKRSTQCVTAARPLQAGETVTSQNQRAGSLVCAASCDDSHLGLALLPVPSPTTPLQLESDGVELRLLAPAGRPAP